MVRSLNMPRSLATMTAASTRQSPDSPRPLLAALATFGSTRLLGNTFIRFPFVLITPLARGLGIPIESATALLGIRELGGLVSPVLGHYADEGHERRVILGSGMATAAACAAIAAGGPVWLVTALFVAGGAAKNGIDTAQNAWIGHRVPFDQRGRTLGAVETAWSGAFLIGVPICAWLTDWGDWRTPYLVLGIAMALMSVVMAKVMGPDRPTESDQTAPIGELLRWRPPSGTWGLYAFACLHPFAQMLVFAVAGDWFVDRLGMSLAGLGFNTLLIGVGELTGTSLTIAFADRIGTRRAAIIGIVLMAPLSALLGAVSSNATLAVALLVALAIAFEFAFVSALILFTEFAPGSRGAGIGSIFAVITVSRALSAVAAGFIYVHLGIGLVGALAAAASVLGALAMAVGTTDS